MLRGKVSAVRYYATDVANDTTYMASYRGMINSDQANRFARDPRAIIQLAQYLAMRHRLATGRIPEIRTLALTSLNGRKPQLFIDPKANLVARSSQADVSALVVPLTEPLRNPPWNVPIQQWERELTLPSMPTVNSPAPGNPSSSQVVSHHARRDSPEH